MQFAGTLILLYFKEILLRTVSVVLLRLTLSGQCGAMVVFSSSMWEVAGSFSGLVESEDDYAQAREEGR